MKYKVKLYPRAYRNRALFTEPVLKKPGTAEAFAFFRQLKYNIGNNSDARLKE